MEGIRHDRGIRRYNQPAAPCIENETADVYAGTGGAVLPVSGVAGYGAAIKETARLTDEKAELGEDDLSALNVKLRILTDHLEESPEVSFVCFRLDERKAGGSYVSVTGKVRRIDETAGQIILLSREKIPIHSVCEMQSEWFLRV